MPGIHSELKCQISFGKCSWRYNGLVWQFCILFAFLDVKIPKKLLKADKEKVKNMINFKVKVLTLYTNNSGISLLYGSNRLSKRVTVVCEKESTKPCLCSKLSLFMTSWQMLEVQPQLSSLDSSLPYLRPLQWVTVWLYNSRGIKDTAH